MHGWARRRSAPAEGNHEQPTLEATQQGSEGNRGSSASLASPASSSFRQLPANELSQTHSSRHVSLGRALSRVPHCPNSLDIMQALQACRLHRM
jgi:hypothetical protein